MTARSFASLRRRFAATTTLAAAVVLAGGVGVLPAHVGAVPAAVAAACEPPTVDLGGLRVSDLPLVDFFGVPQLGCEAVSGTGCGGNGSIGETIPDGLWRGAVMSFNGPTVWDSTSLEFDLWCPYRGEEAERRAADWIAEHGDEFVPWTLDEFMVNNNPRTRTVPIGSYLFMAAAVWMPVSGDGAGSTMNRCVAGYGAPDLELDDILEWETWLYIEGGIAQQIIRTCPYG